VASNRINGPNLGRYDAQHLSVTQRFTQSVAPHVLKDLKNKYELDLEDLDVEELLALLTRDELELSEEAMDLLRKFQKKKKKKRGRGRHQDDSEEAFLDLLDQLEEQEIKAPVEIRAADAPKPFLPPVIQLSNYNPSLEQSRPKKSDPSPTEEEDDFLRLSRPGRIAMAMVGICPSKRSAKKVAKDLEAFGSQVVEEVKRFGTRIIVVSPHQPISKIKLGSLYLFGQGEKTHDGRDWSVVRGAYSAKRRVIVLGEELLDESRRSGRSVVRHEFAHAYEDAWSTKRKRKFPLGVELWYRFEKTRKAFISEYASTKPAEYFAESVEAYFSPQHRERLRAADPDMYQYLSELLD
jgi:Anthrax toxin lethal factor, N- and C-terminal domain